MDLKLELRDRQDVTSTSKAIDLAPIEAEKTRLPSFTSLISDREGSLPHFESASYRQQLSAAPRSYQTDGDNRREHSFVQLSAASSSTMPSSHQSSSRLGAAHESGRERPRTDDIAHRHLAGSFAANPNNHTQTDLSVPNYQTIRQRGRPASTSDPLPAFDTLDVPSSLRSPPDNAVGISRLQDGSRIQQRSPPDQRVDSGISSHRSPGIPSSQPFHPHQGFAQPRYQDSRPVHTFDHRRSSFSSLGGAAEEEDIFARLWNVLLTTMHYNDLRPGDANRTPHNARPMPQIREGDFPILLSYIQSELDHLQRIEPQLARELDFEAQDLHRQLEGLYRRNYDARHSRMTVYSSRQAPRFSPYSRPAEVGGSGGAYRRPSDPFYPNNHSDGMPRRSEASDGRRYSHDAWANVDDTYARHGHLNGYRDDVHVVVQQGSAVASTAATAVDRYGRPVSAVQFGFQPFGQTAYASAAPPVPKRVRKRRDEVVQTCLSCSASETPEWRKGPTGPRTLCNACGLLYAKQCRKREMEAQQALGKRSAAKSRGEGTDRMTNEDRENSLLELQLAVQARASQSAPTVVPMAGAAPKHALERVGPNEGGLHR